jgi:hypothetical protein
MSIGKHERPNNGATDIWLTPIEIVNALGKFDLDPCGELNHPTADKIYTDNGLNQEWYGRVWLNPPYSEVDKWLYKLSEHGNGIALVFARMETKWAQAIIPKASSVFFPKGRIWFLTKEKQRKGNAGAPSMYLSFGEIPDWHKIGEGLIWIINH